MTTVDFKAEVENVAMMVGPMSLWKSIRTRDDSKADAEHPLDLVL